MRKKHNLIVEQMLDRGGKKYGEKSKAGYLWFMEYEGDKFYMTKAGNAYNVQNDPPEKCRECGKGHWVWTSDLARSLTLTLTWFDKARSHAMEGAWGLCPSQRQIPEGLETWKEKPLRHAAGGGGGKCLSVVSLGLNHQKHSVLHRQHGTAQRVPEERRATRTTR